MWGRGRFRSLPNSHQYRFDDLGRYSNRKRSTTGVEKGDVFMVIRDLHKISNNDFISSYYCLYTAWKIVSYLHCVCLHILVDTSCITRVSTHRFEWVSERTVIIPPTTLGVYEIAHTAARLLWSLIEYPITQLRSVHTNISLRCGADISITFCHKSPLHHCISS